MAALGIELTLVVPSSWPEGGAETRLSAEPFEMVEMDVVRSGDVNRHRYTSSDAVARLVRETRPQLLDLHEEPFSSVTRQWLSATPQDVPVTLYTAQNIDKRFPPPFSSYEKAALERAVALYPCSRQAASVARGKGFRGTISVLPLGFDENQIQPGQQSLDDDVLVLGLIGRMVPEKGVQDAVRCLAESVGVRPTRLVLVGSGPEIEAAFNLASSLGVDRFVDVIPWVDAERLSTLYRTMHLVLVPSTATNRWVEQFGRVIVEAQASGAVVAAYASGAIPEVLAGTGILAAEGDVTGLARQVRSTLSDPPTWGRLRAAGLSAAEGRTWSTVARGRLAMYRSTQETNPPSPAGRVRAVEEFGPPAVVGGEPRPFALPGLRKSTAFSRGLASLIDFSAQGRRS